MEQSHSLSQATLFWKIKIKTKGKPFLSFTILLPFLSFTMSFVMSFTILWPFLSFTVLFIIQNCDLFCDYEWQKGPNLALICLWDYVCLWHWCKTVIELVVYCTGVCRWDSRRRPAPAPLPSRYRTSSVALSPLQHHSGLESDQKI